MVTGGAGFIGSHLCEKLLENGFSVVALDNLDEYYDPNIKRENISSINGDFKFIKADITDYKQLENVFSLAEPKYVIHEAAQAGVRASVENPLKTSKVNVEGTLNVLECVRKFDVEKIVAASSSSIYGKVEYLPFDEIHPKNPISPYGVSKLACEHNLRVYHELHGIKYVALRYFTVYGPRIRPDLAIHKFIKKFMKGEEIYIYGNGEKSRDFTYVLDAVDATIKSLKKGFGPYNIGGGTRMTVKELAEKIQKNVGSGKIRYSEDQKGDVIHTSSNTSKAEKDLGWKPKTEFNIGLENTINWMKTIL